MIQHIASAGSLANSATEAVSSQKISRGLQDGELAVALRDSVAKANAIVLIADRRRVGVATNGEADAVWRFEASGDFGADSRRVCD